MTTPTSREAADAFAAMARLIYAGASFDEIYAAVCTTAVAVVPGCDHACVTTAREGRFACEAASDEVARRFDELEIETGEGPCVDAILTDRFELDSDLNHQASWPRLAKRVLADLPVRGVAGYRIMTGERKAGALNLLSDSPGALTGDSATLGAMVAAFASVALAAAAEQATTESLRGALDTSREIGKAVGILMATHQLSDDEAFEMLRTASNRLNVRLAELSRRVVDEHGSPDASRS